jgi:hypothetical protein
MIRLQKSQKESPIQKMGRGNEIKEEKNPFIVMIFQNIHDIEILLFVNPFKTTRIGSQYILLLGFVRNFINEFTLQVFVLEWLFTKKQKTSPINNSVQNILFSLICKRKR